MASADELDARIKQAKKNVQMASLAVAKERELHPTDDKSDAVQKRLAMLERSIQLFEEVLERLLVERQEL